MIRSGARGLICIDADQQSSLSLRNSQRPREHAGQGGKSGEIRFHKRSHCEERAGLFPPIPRVLRGLESPQAWSQRKDHAANGIADLQRDETLRFSGIWPTSVARKVCVQPCYPCVYRRKARRKGFNRIWHCQGGGGESNQICFAKILAGENSKSIAPPRRQSNQECGGADATNFLAVSAGTYGKSRTPTGNHTSCTQLT